MKKNSYKNKAAISEKLKTISKREADLFYSLCDKKPNVIKTKNFKNALLKSGLKIIFCIGETLKEKRNKKTYQVLSKQIKMGLKSIRKKSNIIIAYEPVWSIGTGLIPKPKDLIKSISFIKKKLGKKPSKILYGGSVNSDNINQLKNINIIDGFLIGGASQDPKKFIDIIKKTIN